MKKRLSIIISIIILINLAYLGFKSKSFNKFACNCGWNYACKQLIKMEKITDEQLSSSRKVFGTGCSRGFAEACAMLSRIEYKSGSKIEAQKYGKIACDKDDFRGCTIIGILDFENGDTK